MCNWQDKVVIKGDGRRIALPYDVFQDACKIIWQSAQQKRLIYYSDIEKQLKRLGHRKINRGTIGDIVGEVSIQVSQVTSPSIYPSAIVVHKGDKNVGIGFWEVDTGTNPPSKVPPNQQKEALLRYQNDVFNKPWDCNC
jgi:hypothetical protein